MNFLRPIFLSCVAGCIFLAMAEMAMGDGVQNIKTSYKQYTLVTFQGLDVLCEPYVVQKNDWLYKIFIKKGEIAETDFPFFISVFKQFNPHIHNIDAITPGTRILIPLKITAKLEYSVDKDGRVNIPVVEFHDTIDTSSPRVKVQDHVVVPGDTVSSLLDPAFLKKGGGITREGQILFYQLNPHIKNIHRIHLGDRIKIPVPPLPEVSMVRASALPPVKSLSSDQIQRLQAYAATMNGRLTHQGELHFPGRNGQKEIQLDLSETPLIETDDPGKSILIFPNDSSRHPLQDKETRQVISSYWKKVTIQPINFILASPSRQKRARSTLKPASSTLKSPLSRKQISQIVTQAGFDHVPDDIIRFHVNHIPVSARLDRIKRPDRQDLLLNFGTVFGQGIRAIQQNNYDILSFSSKQDWQEQTENLLSALGFTVWENPSFTYQGAVETLTGIYGEQSSLRLFVSRVPVTPMTRSFLKDRRIRHVSLNP